MRFITASYPELSLAGMLVYHTLLVLSLAKGKKHCSKPYVALLAFFELILASVLLAGFYRSNRSLWFWNMVLMSARNILCLLWVWIALEMSGFRPAHLNPRAVVAVLAVPIAFATAMLFCDPVLHWYWASVSFEGGFLVVERGALGIAFLVYCQTLIWIGFIVFLVGIPWHFGRERARLILFFISFSIMFAGDSLWRLGFSVPGVTDPLALTVAIGSFIQAFSAASIGFPLAREPVTGKVIAAAAEKEISNDSSEGESASPRAARSVEAVLSGVGELSARQREIASLVVSGLTYRAIAERFGCTERTIKYHMGEILDKCALETREQFIAWVAVRRVEGIRG